jgi:hypothetical protein
LDSVVLELLAAMRLTTGPSKNTLMKVTRVKRRFLIALLGSVVCIGLGAFSDGVSAEGRAADAVVEDSAELEFDWVQDQVEAELGCDEFESCLHIEALGSSRCLDNVAVDFGFEDEYGQWLGDAVVVVPSPRFAGGFVIEFGVDKSAVIGDFGIYEVSCSGLLPTEVGVA